MKGHERVIAMRLHRAAPDAVLVSECPIDDCRKFRPEHTEVEIRTSESPKALDLRWAVGLDVTCRYQDRDYALHLHRALVAAKAKTVKTYVLDKQTGAVEFWKSNEKGNSSWQT